MKGRIKKQKGFTLIEILIVIAIIGILAAVLVPRMSGFFSQGKQAAFNKEKESLQTAVDAYFANSAVERRDLPGNPEGPGLYPTYSGKGGRFPRDVRSPNDGDADDKDSSIINMDFLMSGGNTHRGHVREGYISDYPKSSCQNNGNKKNPGHYCWYVDKDGKVRAKYYDEEHHRWRNGFQGVYP